MSQEIKAPQPEAVPLVVRTAPARIWLQISDDATDKDQPFPISQEATWCGDSVSACEVKYVRADLVADLVEIVRITIGNVRSLGPAGALGGVYMPYRVWLAELESAYTKATGAQA